MTESHSATDKVDVLVVTALELERKAVVARLSNHQIVNRDERRYDAGSIGGRRAVVLFLGRMGNTAAAAATATAIHHFDPTNVVLAGIAGGTNPPDSDAGLADQSLLGDLVVGELIVDYESAKQEAGEGGGPAQITRRFEPFRSDSRLLEAARRLPDGAWALAIRESRPDGTSGRIIPRAWFGVIASGQKVVKDPGLVAELKASWPKLIGVEMEGAGVALAVHDAFSKPAFFVVKGICDWADPDKNDQWQRYAADASAAFLEGLVSSLYGRASDQQAEQPPAAMVGVAEPAMSFPGEVKLQYCRRLRDDWHDLADIIGIPEHERARFATGLEARAIWGWLERRQQLARLPDALSAIGRGDLAGLFTPNPQ